MSIEQAISVPERTRPDPYIHRLSRAASGAPIAICVGIDPAPESLVLLKGTSIGLSARDGRTSRAAVMERFAGLLIESARDHAAAVKLQCAWFEAAGAAGMRALERTIDFARTAGLIVILDAKRGDVPHTASAYAEAWLGDSASTSSGVDAMTINPSIGPDSVAAMANIAADRNCALYALLVTSNTGANTFQYARLESGEMWWELVARELSACDQASGGGIVGAVVGATHPELLERARTLLPNAPLLIPGVGPQGGTISKLVDLNSDRANDSTSLVSISRALLPETPMHTAGFRYAAASAVEKYQRELYDTNLSPSVS